jgi:hypothetical protein
MIDPFPKSAASATMDQYDTGKWTTACGLSIIRKHPCGIAFKWFASEVDFLDMPLCFTGRKDGGLAQNLYIPHRHRITSCAIETSSKSN